MILPNDLYDSTDMTTFERVSANEWEKWVSDNGAVVLDVREPKEWELGTLDGAVLISQGDVVARIDELDKQTPVLCVCRSGNRSASVAMFMAFNGYTVANLEGGLKDLGMPT